MQQSSSQSTWNFNDDDNGRPLRTTRSHDQLVAALFWQDPAAATEPVDLTLPPLLDDGEYEEEFLKDNDANNFKSGSWYGESGAPQARAPCPVCFADFDIGEAEVALACVACGQGYCLDCLVESFNAAFSDRSLWPVKCRCSEPVLLEDVAGVLPQAMLDEHAEKFASWSATLPLFCASEICSAFLLDMDKVEDPERFISCAKCERKTCSLCRGPEQSHNDGARCPARVLNEVEQEILKQGKGHRCRCQAVIERTEGCDRMTCPGCRWEFCAACGVEWPKCKTPGAFCLGSSKDNWDEDPEPEQTP